MSNNYSELMALPDVNFVDVDPTKTEKDIITLYENLANTVLYPGDPIRLFLTTLAAVISQQHAIINDTGRQNLLRYARGAALEHIGAPFDVHRLPSTFCEATMRFTIQEVLTFPVVIPKGTRVTHDGKTYFETKEEMAIKAGQTSAQVTVVCLSAGAAYNGLEIGQLNRLVDPIAYVIDVTNISKTQGGTDQESDDALRKRIALSPEKFSTAGPELAYLFWATSASPKISDVSATCPTPGTVLITVLLENGQIPAQNSAEIQAVKDILNDEKHRPLTDTVIVQPAEAVEIDYTVTWYMNEQQSGFFKETEQAIAQAVAQFEHWQMQQLGRDLVDDELKQLCRAAGAKRIVIQGFNYKEIQKTQVCKFVKNPRRIIFGGTEEA